MPKHEVKETKMLLQKKCYRDAVRILKFNKFTKKEKKDSKWKNILSI